MKNHFLLLTLSTFLIFSGCTQSNSSNSGETQGKNNSEVQEQSNSDNGAKSKMASSKIKINESQKFEKVTEFKKEVLIKGDGNEAKAGDNISVHYYGRFIDGKKFDSSLDRGQPFQFKLGGGMVIKGWDQGLVGMKVGEVSRLHIPSSMGYGDNDFGPISGGSTLIFDVELVGIN